MLSRPDPGSSPAAGSLRARLFSWPILALALLLVLLAGWGGSRMYVQRRDRMLFAAASHAIDSRDFPSAWYWLARLYRAHPDDIATVRLIAHFAAAERSPEELAWRVRVIQIGPATLDDYLAWASTALRLGQTAVALEALDHVPTKWRDAPAYHELLGGALAIDGQLQAADNHYAAAARLDPSNALHAVNLAALRLTSIDAAARQSARATLERLAPAEPLPALRALLGDAVRQRDTARVARFRSALLQQPGRSLDDELACVGTAPTIAEGRAELAAGWKSVEGDPPRALQVAEWMIHNGDFADALDWLRKLPAGAQSTIAIQTAEADALAALHDWPALRASLDGKKWGTCDFLRVALLVRAARETGASAPKWPEAVAACRGDTSDLLLLAQCAAGWSWQTESEALYWQISLSGYPARGPALKALWDFYSSTANSSGLLRVAREQYGDSPANGAVRNNFAFLSLLTGAGLADATRIAKEDYEQQEENPNVAATYAYSLYLDGRYEDGFRILNRFGEQRMQAAGAVLYLALLQQATGQKDAATHAAATVDPRKLLPEERVLLQKIVG